MTLLEAQEIVAAHAPGPYYATDYRAWEDEYLARVCAVVEGLPPGRVLDIGPGWGTMMTWLAGNGWQVEVCDFIPLGHWITPALLDLARAQFHQRDIFMGPLAVGAYDLVLMTQVLTHLKFRPDEVIATCREMLKPGGKLLASVFKGDQAITQAPFGDDWRAVPQYGSAPAVPDMVSHIYTLESFRDLLTTSFPAADVWQPEGSPVMFGLCERER